MHDTLATLHADTYNSLADDYESRVETYRSVTTHALLPFISVLPAGSKVLDIGCAVGYVVEILRAHQLNAEGVDIADAMIEYARKRNPGVRFVVGDFLETPYEAGEFDAVVLYAFLHLFPKEIAIQCIERILTITKNNGVIFVGTTKSATSSEGFEEKSDYDSSAKRFRKRWTKEELEVLFSEHDLAILNYEENTDEFGKVWMDFVVQKTTG
ncbi:MAG: class I SAM-dependent methyltransferase [Candidatus Saccharimonadota bacterium]